MRSADEIAELFLERRRNAGTERERMRQIRDLYNGDIVVPLTELQREERSAVVNLAKQGINQMGMRAASTQPMVRTVVSDYGQASAARKRADLRRRINHGWWGASRLNLQMRQRGRFLFAYASAPTLIKPCFNPRSRAYNMPEWNLRSPLDAYCAPLTGMTDYLPGDAMFAQTRSVGWVRVHHPAHAAHFRECGPDDLVDVVEYVDHEQLSLVMLLSARRWHDARDALLGGGNPMGHDYQGKAVMLLTSPNRAGCPLAVVSGNVSLDRRVGQYDGIVGMYQAQARLQALSLIARERGVFQETYLVQHPNSQEAPVIEVPADPRTGRMGVVRNGQIDRTTIDPQYATDPGIDRLERSQRVEAGVPADWGGESASNVRTGRRGADIMSAAIDPMLHEAHDIFAAALEDENRIAIKVDKAWWGDETKSFYVSWGGDDCKVVYSPNNAFAETDEHRVRYPLPGADVHEINIATGQAVGAGIMSKQTAAEMNPLIENAEKEHDLIVAEQLEQAQLTQILTLASTPEGPYQPADLARLAELVKSDRMELFEAVLTLQREAQERQAAVPETPADAMPGLSMPGQGAEQAGAFQTAPDQQGLNNLLSSLTMPQLALRTANRA
jgi:hypothetical protein